jgi:hypothetical protein
MVAEHLQNFSYIGLTESFSADFSGIPKKLGIAEPVTEQKQFASIEPLDPKLLFLWALEILRERLGIDYRLRDNARALLREHNGKT